MYENLNFKPEYYTITQLVEPNVIEVEGTWFIKLKGVSPQEDVKRWLKKGDIIRVIPYRRSADARIISDVWLGNTHINRQFPSYEFMRAFESWKNVNSEKYSIEEEQLIQAFRRSEILLPDSLKASFYNWKKNRFPEQKIGSKSFVAGEVYNKREQIKHQMIQEFNKWKKELL